jgi:hypothetical protein
VRPHEIIHDLAASQLGLVSYDQLRHAKLSHDVIRTLRDRSALIRVLPRVYAVAGSPDSDDRRLLAAVLASGPQSFVSHESGARAFQFTLPTDVADDLVHITTLYERCPRIDGIALHRMGVLLDRDVTQVRSIPVASAALIIVQMSSKLGLRDLGRLTDDALRLGLTSLREIRALSARLGRAPGRSPRNVELMLQERTAEHEALESVLEKFVSDALRRFDVPAPVAQCEVFVDGHRRRIDLSYPEKMVALEAKGFAYHGTRSRFDEDAQRINGLRLAGWTVLEFTSAFTDLQIAQQVARALRLPPPLAKPALSYAEWKALR